LPNHIYLFTAAGHPADGGSSSRRKAPPGSASTPTKIPIQTPTPKLPPSKIKSFESSHQGSDLLTQIQQDAVQNKLIQKASREILKSQNLKKLVRTQEIPKFKKTKIAIQKSLKKILMLKTKVDESKKAHVLAKDQHRLASIKKSELGNDSLIKKNRKVLGNENGKLASLKKGQKLLHGCLEKGQIKIERIEWLLAKAGQGLESLQDEIKRLSRGDRARLVVHKQIYNGFKVIEDQVDKVANVASLKKKFGAPVLDAAKTAWRNWKAVSKSKRDSKPYKRLQESFQNKSLEARMNCHRAESKNFKRKAKIYKLSYKIVMGKEIMASTYLLKELMKNLFQSRNQTPKTQAA
jgi:hypothetical protein